MLLERIELGRHARASLLRLERLLASASPALRARILRLVRAEVARLRDGGLTAAERRRVQRLQPVIAIFSGGASASTRSSPLDASQTPMARVKEADNSGASVAPESSKSSQMLPLTGTGPLPPRESGSGEESGQSIFGLPSPGWEVPLGVYLAFAVLLVLSLGALALAAAPPQALPAGRVRTMMKLSRANFGVTGATTLAGLTFLLALTFLLGSLL